MAESASNEQHPNFPSGAWEGFYLYRSGPAAQRHSMSFHLEFQDGKITGSGSDDVGPLSWAGTYDVGSMAVTMVKIYRTHQVAYQGVADTNGIYGSWSLFSAGGGFHIWPKKDEEETIAEAVKVEEKELFSHP